MSHITEVKTQIKDLVCLKKALDELGYTWQEAQPGQALRVRGWNQTQAEADLVLGTKSSYDIGVRLRADGTYEFLADWWGVESHAGFTQDAFMRQVLPRYSYHKVVAEVKARGYDIVAEEASGDQSLKVTVRKWV
jgi:hypothetical protein